MNVEVGMDANLGVAMAKAAMVRFLMDFGGFMERVKEEFLILIHAHDLKHDILFFSFPCRTQFVAQSNKNLRE